MAWPVPPGPIRVSQFANQALTRLPYSGRTGHMGAGRAGRPARCRVIAASGAVRRRLLRRLGTAAPGRPRRLPGKGPRGLADEVAEVLGAGLAVKRAGAVRQ